MAIYELFKSDGKTIVKGSLTQVMRELFAISEKNGDGLIGIEYNEKEAATEFKFEGNYCNFSVFLK